MKKTPTILFSICFPFALLSCDKTYEPGTSEHIKSVTDQVDTNRLLNADESPGDWLSYGRNYAEDRYSSLNQITKSNIKELGLAWSFNLGTTRGIEATPLVVDGIMYISGPWSIVYAIDARKGELIWTYDPEVPKEHGEKACCDVVNRGIALYKGHIFVGSLDGRLISINAATGKKVWEVLTVDQSKAYTITGAPRVVDGKVIIGNGGAEYGVRGYVTAYDAMTGNQMWRFYTVPGDPSKPFESKAMEDAAKTWAGEWWRYGGGGTAWDAMAYDPELKLLYIGTGNGGPWSRELRSPGGGDNLYLSSIVALNPDDGELVWYYQTTPGDSWDYTATQHIILADMEINGILRKVLMQAPKNGFFYVIDRTDGKLISGDPYTYVNWAKGIDVATGRPIENDFSRYIDINAVIAPSAIGGHNWQPMAFNPKTKLVYIPSRELSMMYGHEANWKFKDDPNSKNTGRGYDATKSVRQDSLAPAGHGKLIAWDPIEKKEVWQVKQPSPWNAGVLTTSELVFQGTAEGNFVAYDASSGEKVWETALNTGIIAAPITYLIDDVQYVSIAVGWGGVLGLWSKYAKQINPGTIYTFALGKNESIPSYPDKPEPKLISLSFEASEGEIKNGDTLFKRYCASCHNLNGGGVIPDLTFSSPETFAAFKNIVLEGQYLGKGMPKFKDRLSEQDVEDVLHYILSIANNKLADLGVEGSSK
ncbi:PQQ-dependent dehydrogenase, methanol/ethanol family [Cognataquiflexum rubidum]|uniref:PQQ-dependent dehydrogenase, methanol/ethanol family n=1 Tax=Cognataquiflexum rubidum TaxID=2922273 RepID=UPI001F136BC5|nr:PQQ-dependent dehydrogenase, methanol/ethanol family [Cognataquiflexum rubidum]MCH6235838.1 PQQ-dependent dehydrogenase, methanol/ethanol family [Cognataquiflexum rubidum]